MYRHIYTNRDALQLGFISDKETVVEQLESLKNFDEPAILTRTAREVLHLNSPGISEQGFSYIDTVDNTILAAPPSNGPDGNQHDAQHEGRPRYQPMLLVRFDTFDN